jgi:hypothetical protein
MALSPFGGIHFDGVAVFRKTYRQTSWILPYDTGRQSTMEKKKPLISQRLTHYIKR